MLILKGKPILSSLLLFLAGNRRFRVTFAAQIHAGEQFIAATQSIAHPLPANLQVARSPRPMRINKTTFASLDHRGSLRHQVQRGHGQDQTQPLQGLGRANQGRFQLKAIGFIVQKVLLNIETKTVFLQRFDLGGFVADDVPVVVASLMAEPPPDAPGQSAGLSP